MCPLRNLRLIALAAVLSILLVLLSNNSNNSAVSQISQPAPAGPRDNVDLLAAAAPAIGAQRPAVSLVHRDDPSELVRVYERKGSFRTWLREGADPSNATDIDGIDAFVVSDSAVAMPAVTTAGCVSPLSLAGRKWRWVVRTLPPIMYNGQPCATATHREAMCGCKARALLVHHVFFGGTDGVFGSRMDVLAGTTSVGTGELCVVDRVSVFYSLHRCMGVWWDAPLRARETYRRVRLAVGRNATVPILIADTHPPMAAPAQPMALQEGFYAADIHAYAPGHAFESILEGLGQYFIAGLHRRGVPWLIPLGSDGRRTPFWHIATEIMDILAAGGDTIPLVPLPIDGRGPIAHVPRVWFASTPLGILVPCYKPFLRTVLYPRALVKLRKLRQEGMGGMDGNTEDALPLPIRRVALLKLSGDSNLFTATRTFHRSASFDTLLQRHNITLLRNKSIVERLYFLNEAHLIVTNFGASMSFLANMILQRPTVPRTPLHVVVLVHSGYASELFGMIGVRLSLGEAFLVREQLPRPWQLSYALATPGLRVKFVRVDTLDNVTDATFDFPDAT